MLSSFLSGCSLAMKMQMPPITVNPRRLWLKIVVSSEVSTPTAKRRLGRVKKHVSKQKEVKDEYVPGSHGSHINLVHQGRLLQCAQKQISVIGLRSRKGTSGASLQSDTR